MFAMLHFFSPTRDSITVPQEKEICNYNVLDLSR